MSSSSSSCSRMAAWLLVVISATTGKLSATAAVTACRYTAPAAERNCVAGLSMSSSKKLDRLPSADFHSKAKILPAFKIETFCPSQWSASKKRKQGGPGGDQPLAG